MFSRKGRRIDLRSAVVKGHVPSPLLALGRDYKVDRTRWSIHEAP